MEVNHPSRCRRYSIRIVKLTSVSDTAHLTMKKIRIASSSNGPRECLCLMRTQCLVLLPHLLVWTNSGSNTVSAGPRPSCQISDLRKWLFLDESTDLCGSARDLNGPMAQSRQRKDSSLSFSKSSIRSLYSRNLDKVAISHFMLHPLGFREILEIVKTSCGFPCEFKS